MSRTISLTLLVSVFIVGLSLVNYAQPTSADTLTQGATQEPAAIPMTRTAEAAAVQTIEAALATPEPTNTPPPKPTATATPPSTIGDFWSFWTPFRVTYRPFALATWAYDDSTIDQWYGLGFLWFLGRLVLAIVLLPVDLILIVILGIGAALQRLLGETARNIYFGLLALFVLLMLWAGRA